ncbi:50S ribosomal protein L5 [Candidatus Omnitrophota bacterium]
MKPRLIEKYKTEITDSLMQKLGFKNKFQVPRLEKIVVNMGVGVGAQDIKVLEEASKQLALITGQRPTITRSKKAISNFKIRKNASVGCRVTLRGYIMYEFFDRLISAALPRIRDFRGFPKSSFDSSGNYSLGIVEQTIFPEIDIDKVQRMQGMDIIIVTTAENRELCYELLRAFGFPFRA